MKIESEQNIFEACNYDAYNFLKKHTEIRELTGEELRHMRAVVEVINNSGKGNNCVLGPGVSTCLEAIFRLEDGTWVVWNTDERRGLAEAKQFGNISDACMCLIKRLVSGVKTEEAIHYFKEILSQEIQEEELEVWAKRFDYTVSYANKRKLTKK